MRLNITGQTRNKGRWWVTLLLPLQPQPPPWSAPELQQLLLLR